MLSFQPLHNEETTNIELLCLLFGLRMIVGQIVYLYSWWNGIGVTSCYARYYALDPSPAPTAFHSSPLQTPTLTPDAPTLSPLVPLWFAQCVCVFLRSTRKTILDA